MSDKLIRVFIAIDVPDSIRNVANVLKSKMDEKNNPVKWVRTENIHITLRFIGSTIAKEVEKLNTLLSVLTTRYSEFPLVASGTGCFPKIERPRVLWLGVGGSVSVLNRIIQEISEEMAIIGYPIEATEYYPHITIGRIRYPQKVTPNIGSFLSADYPPVEINVSNIRLYRSETLPGGSVYSLLGTHHLCPK